MSVVGAPVLVVLPWHGLRKSLTCVEQPGSSSKPPVLRSECDPHPAGPQSAASSSHQPKNKQDDRFNGLLS